MERLTSADPSCIGAYRLLGRLGEGGMGRVYLARSARGRTVAVKVVQAELARNAEFRRRFAQEIAAARRVGGEWTAPVLDADTEAETPWVATGYIAGPSLQQVVSDDFGPLPEHSVRSLAAGLTRALEAIHGAGLVHRDLKPSNILVTIDGPRVIDFGIARALDTVTDGGLTRTGAILGSPGFMSPEQVRGQPVTPAGDVFCLGAVLAFAATGRMPFGTADSGVHALMFRIVEEQPDLAGMSGPLRELVSDCLVKDPQARPPIAALLERTAEAGRFAGAWLPGEVLAQLGRHAVQLLDTENPETSGVALAKQDGPAGGSGTGAGTGTGSGTGFGTGAGSGSAAATAAGPPGAPATPPPAGYATPPPYGYASQQTGPYRTPSPYQSQQAQPYHSQQAHQSWTSAAPPPMHTPPPMGAPPMGPPPQTGYPMTGPLRPAPPGRLESPRSLATGLCVTLGVILLLSLVELVRNLVLWSALEELAADPIGELGYAAGELDGHRTATEAMEVIVALVSLPAMVLWLLWFWRLRTNAELFAPGQLRHQPALAVASWFIPIGHFFLPKQIANDIWRAGHPATGAAAWPGQRPAGSGGLLNAWWALWVVQLVFMYLLSWSSWYDSDSVEEAAGEAALDVFQSLTAIPAAILAILVVLQFTKAQEQRMGRQR